MSTFPPLDRNRSTHLFLTAERKSGRQLARWMLESCEAVYIASGDADLAQLVLVTLVANIHPMLSGRKQNAFDEEFEIAGDSEQHRSWLERAES